jgi:hypothetical protein
VNHLECTQCKYVNSSDAEFCGSCGSPLLRTTGIAEPAIGKSQELQLAERRIKNAYIGGTIQGTATLLFTMAAIASGSNILGLDAWALLDVGLIYGLTYGVYKKSRVCAGLLFGFTLIGGVIMLVETEMGSVYLGRIVGSVLFGYHFFRGFQGTITCHRLVS